MLHYGSGVPRDRGQHCRQVGEPALTTTSAATGPATVHDDELWRMLHPSELRPAQRSPEEHAALETLLHACCRLEEAAMYARRRETFRMTRSLLAASRVLGFTVPELAAIMGVTAGSIRNRSTILAPIPRALFRTLLTDLPGDAGDAGDGAMFKAGASKESDGEEHPVQLLTWYLSATYVGHREDPA